MTGVFKKITNDDIYREIKHIKKDVTDIKMHLVTLNGSVSNHRRWLTYLTGAFGSGFICIVGWLLKVGYK